MGEVLIPDALGNHQHRKYYFDYMTHRKFREYEENHEDATVIGFMKLKPVTKGYRDEHDDDTYLRTVLRKRNEPQYFLVTEQKPKYRLFHRYICVGQNRFVEYDIFSLLLLLPLILLFAILFSCSFIFGWWSGDEPDDAYTVPDSAIQIADTVDYDDSPIDVEANDNVDMQTEADGEIALNLYSYHKLNVNDTLALTNISSNTVNLQYIISDVDTNKTIYTSGLIAPGQKEEWKASSYLKAGTNHLTFLIVPYTNDKEKCVGTDMAVTIDIQ